MKYQITKKHAVRLAMMTNSFYDPDCGANLFKSSPVYQFNHKPTQNIIDGVKGGSLIDITGNILEGEIGTANGEVDLKAFEAEVTARVKAEMEKEHAKTVQVLQNQIAELAATQVQEEKPAEAEVVEEVAETTTKATGKKK